MPSSKSTASKPKASRPVTSSQVKLTLVKSKFGRLKNHRACVAGLGLHRMHQSVVVADTPENRGMINRIAYMLLVEQV